MIARHAIGFWSLVVLVAILGLPGAGAAAVCSPASPGATHWWGGDNNALDLVGTSDGAMTGTATFAPGLVGEAFDFDGFFGVSGYAEVPEAGVGDFAASPFTVSFWMQPDNASQVGQYLLGKSHPDGGQGWDMRLNNGAIQVFGLNGWTPGIVTGPVIVTGTWHHVALIADGSTTTIYVDGLPQAGSARSAITTASNPFRIGMTTNFGGYTFDGRIDEVQIHDRALSADEVAAIHDAGSSGQCRPCEAPPAGALSWWRGERNGADSAGDNDGVISNGAAFATGLAGEAFSFDGVDDYVEIPDSPSLNPGTAFTVDGWFYLDPDAPEHAGDIAPLVDKSSGGSLQGGWYLIFDDRTADGFSKSIRFVVMSGVVGNYSEASANALAPAAGWYHVAATYDQAASPQSKLYVNGGLAAQSSGSFTLLPNSIPVRIGAMHDREYGISPPGSTWRMKGLADEVRFSGRVLVADEVAAVYNARETGVCGACVAQPAGLVAWWGADGNAADLAGGNDGTLLGGAAYAGGRVGQAFSFDGVSARVEIPDSASLDITGAITLEAWIFRGDASHSGLLNKGAINTNGVYDLAIYLDKFYFRLNGADLNMPSATSIPVGAWTHVAGTYDGTTAKIYINGALDASQPYSGAIATDDNPLHLGLYGAPVAAYFNGRIDELGVFSRALTAEELRAISAAGAGGICRSCAPRPAGIVSWWRGETGAGDFLGAADGTFVNGTTVAAGLVGQALSFDGTDDRVDFPATTADFGADPFTVEFLMRFPASEIPEQNNYIMGKSPDPATGWDLRLNGVPATDGRLVVTGVNGWAFNIFSADPLAADRWQHVALVGSASEVNLYVDGTLQGSSPRGTIGTATQPFRMGMTTNFVGSHFTGRLDETAIYDRALSQSEVAQIANAQGAGKCTATDTTPDAFAFSDQTGAALSTPITSNGVTVTGIDFPAAISLPSCTGTGCGYAVNGGAFTAAAGTVSSGDSVQVRQTSSASYGTTTDLVLDIGGVTDIFSVTTLVRSTVTANADGNGSGTVSSDVGGISFSYPGAASGSTAAIDAGTAVELAAAAATGSTASWDDCAAAGGTHSGGGTTSATCTFAALSEDETVTATFTLDTPTLTVTLAGNGSGSVTPDSGALTWVGGTGTGDYGYGTSVVLTAVADPGSEFAGWGGGCDTLDGRECTVSVTGARGVTATFGAEVDVCPTCGLATVQEAIDAAGPGDVLRLAAGVYRENLVVAADKRLTISGGWDATFAGQTPDPSLTVLNGDVDGDGWGEACVLLLDGTGGAVIDVSLANLTLSDGFARVPGGYGLRGGGIRAVASGAGAVNLSLDAVAVTDNRADEEGGGLYALAGSGGRVAVEMVNTLVADNTAPSVGGIAVIGDGAGAASSATLHSCTVSGNRADRAGGVYAGSQYGATATVSAANTILWGNVSDTTGGDLRHYEYDGGGDSTTTVAASFSDVGEVVADPSYPGTYTPDTTIDADPLFVNALAGDYRLHEGSPALDAGTATGAPPADFAGDARPQGPGYDLGADERVASVPAGVRLLSPNGGERLAAGSPFTFTWEAPAAAESFRVFWKPNVGKRWTRAGTVTGQRHLAWTAPALARASTRVARVVAYDGPGATGSRVGTDLSDGPHVIETVRVLWPAGGERLASGETVQVRWWTTPTPKNAVAKTKVMFTVNAGKTWRNVPGSPFAGNPGGAAWTPSYARAKRKCRVKVILLNARGRVVGSDSGGPWFRIAP